MRIVALFMVMGLTYTGIGEEVQGAAAQPWPTEPRLLFVAPEPERPALECYTFACAPRE